MAAKRLQRKRKSAKALTISKKVKSYDNATLFAKKANSMEVILKKHGLPKESVGV
ncbi:MAG: hypothetical protein JST46_11780 [Bacteroidetes bacterium]|nr:hypothetical protein [Bacteroidota bacterium]